MVAWPFWWVYHDQTSLVVVLYCYQRIVRIIMLPLVRYENNNDDDDDIFHHIVVVVVGGVVVMEAFFFRWFNVKSTTVTLYCNRSLIVIFRQRHSFTKYKSFTGRR